MPQVVRIGVRREVRGVISGWVWRLWGVFCGRVVDPRAGMVVLTSVNLLMMALQCCFLLTEWVWWWLYLNTYTLGLFTAALYPCVFLALVSEVRLPWSPGFAVRLVAFQLPVGLAAGYLSAYLGGHYSPCGIINRGGYHDSDLTIMECVARYRDLVQHAPSLFLFLALVYSAGLVARSRWDPGAEVLCASGGGCAPPDESLVRRLKRLRIGRRILWWTGLVLQMPSVTLWMRINDTRLPLPRFPKPEIGLNAFLIILFAAFALWIAVARLRRASSRILAANTGLKAPENAWTVLCALLVLCTTALVCVLSMAYAVSLGFILLMLEAMSFN